MAYRNPKTLKHAAKGYITVVTIGDSSAAANPAYGTFADTDDGRLTPWPQVLAKGMQGKKHAWIFYNRAVNGDTLEMMRERFDRDALSLDPDIIHRRRRKQLLGYIAGGDGAGGGGYGECGDAAGHLCDCRPVLRHLARVDRPHAHDGGAASGGKRKNLCEFSHHAGCV